MANFYMLVGIPGSGKSTWAESNQEKLHFNIYSSDTLRKELFNNVNFQGNNQKVFQIMNERTIHDLKSGINVCYDSTAINRKDRKGILNSISNMQYVKKIAVVFLLDIETCKKRNKERLRVVPDRVIDNMISRFELPFQGEGFDEIHFIEDDSFRKVNFVDAYEKMHGFDQKSKHHTLTLLDHCIKCQDYVLEKNTEFDVLPEISVAALFHDYGKLFTVTWDEKNQCNHYYNHENVGAYKFLTEIDVPYWINRYDVAFYINYHMIPYVLEKMSEKKRNDTINKFRKNEFMWKALQIIHEGDVYAH